MIPKVNRPEFPRLVRPSQAPENDPGSSQGGALGYERPMEGNSNSSENQDSEENSSPEGDGKARLSIVTAEPLGMGNIVLEFREAQKNASPRPGLRTQYQQGGGNSKGLLLNKKA